ncbi:MAG: PD-(D/E)XK nuclease domain-containing protein [Verrucomicrobia bacterium]|nr:PD-(D/E)XK nuclease domain-containing protein [Verrucomicrobiota bacterium]
MARYFNTTGPCMPHMHYMLPPADRLIGASLDRYIRDQLYWVLHAPRQTGKTTFLQSWMREINSGTEAIACYVSVECCQGVAEAERAIPAILHTIAHWAAWAGIPVPPIPDSPCEAALNEQVTAWAALCAPKPLVVLFDEVDVLEGPAMISFLRQLRGGFASRGVSKFPVSIALVGMRDLRDYLAHSKDGIPVNPGSPFNIKHSSVSLGNFSQADIAALTAQHTGETGQVFGEDALARIWHYTSGQPWLVNALCEKIVYETAPTGKVDAVTAAHVDAAKELLIQSRATHIDSLGERLKDDRVRKVIQPMIIGQTDAALGRADRDVEFCMDLGLIAWEGSLVIANAIYREVIARYLSQNFQDNIPEPEFRWKRDDGGLDMDALLAEFQKFWRRHAEMWEEKADYTEAFPHLLLMAFLQRVVNGGGNIEREYAAGRGRVDLMIDYGGRRNIIEIKLVHPADGRQTTLEEGLEQIARYENTVGADTLHLVIFDRRPEYRAKPWEERLAREERSTATGKPVAVVWC